MSEGKPKRETASQRTRKAARERLTDRLEILPNSPGVYLMKDAQDVIIYIGKAVNLRNRVRSYFMGGAKEHRAAMILPKHVTDIDWILTGSELEALILEANLIRKHRPRYNVLAKDDKHFPYIQVTWGEDFPRVRVVRKVEDKSRHHHFGPFTDSGSLRQALATVREIFRVRSCDLKLPGAKVDRACLDHHIGRCDAPCIGLQTRESYRAMMRQVELALEGKEDVLRQELTVDMQACVERLDFETAAHRRDQIKSLGTLRERQRVDLAEAVDVDVVALSREGRWGVVTWMEIRGGCVQGRHHETLSCPLSEDDAEVMAGAVVGRYLDRLPPPEILVSCLPDSTPLLEEHFTQMLGRKVEILLARQGKRFRLAELAHANARMLLVEHLAHLEARDRVTNSVKELQEALGLPEPPRRIEGFDISHLSGTGTVASMVVCIDGKPAKGEYRRFHVKTVEGIDDFASMREILGRRFRRIREDGLTPPDLVLIDGGKGQLGMAVEAMEAEGFPDQKVLGLAKRIEEVFLPGESEPRILPRASSALQLLQRLRDEAHRFAITFQREQRTATITSSWLDGIKGVGAQKKQLLLRHFGSAAKVREAKEAELAQIVGPAVAASIAELVRRENAVEPEPGLLMAAEESA